MRTLYLSVLALLAVLAASSLPQEARAQGRIRVNKAPKYADDVFVPEKNALFIRVPIGFYAYSYASSAYKDKHVPVLLGVRYEHLVKSRTGFGLEVEYNSWDPQKTTGTKDIKLPAKEQTTKFTPFLKFYTRSNKKNFFIGPFLTVGPSIMLIQQDQDLNALQNNQYFYKANTVLGIDFSVGAQLIFRRKVILGTSVEGIFTGARFKQEAFYKTNVGNGSFFLNPFKFYVGLKF